MIKRPSFCIASQAHRLHVCKCIEKMQESYFALRFESLRREKNAVHRDKTVEIKRNEDSPKTPLSLGPSSVVQRSRPVVTARVAHPRSRVVVAVERLPPEPRCTLTFTHITRHVKHSRTRTTQPVTPARWWTVSHVGHRCSTANGEGTGNSFQTASIAMNCPPKMLLAEYIPNP
ncbi:hypothetical protein PUN28_003087 [Cardiocondyla obscurior]|uniref:Uncharacterized protein n=1 Tax=Cardiocondyla obscurior TaxID=286306 RepID=A0AAW2GH75_9HYME